MISLLSAHFGGAEVERATGRKEMEEVLETLTDCIKKSRETSQVTEVKQPRPQKQKKHYVPLSLDDISQAERFEKYFTVRFDINHKRLINPYDLIGVIKQKTGGNPKVWTMNKTSFLARVDSKEESEKMAEITEVKQYKCETKAYDRFNHIKGLIYISEYEVENLAEFKTWLQESYAIVDVERAAFIKTRPGTTAYIVTFNQEQLPYSIYIPGERQDTRVQPFTSRPMMCHKCQGYGHTVKRCDNEKVCRKCAEEGHDKENCEKSENEYKCCHCAGQHMAGSKECAKQQREIDLISVQLQQKVTFRRALQILEGESETQKVVQEEFVRRFDCQMSESDKKKFSPWALEKAFTNYLNSKPKCIRTKGKDTFTVEISTKEDSDMMRRLTTIMNCAINTAESRDRQVRALMYVKEYSMIDFEGYKKGLLAQYGFQDVIEASWIKVKSGKAKALLVSMNGTEWPTFIELPGEQEKTRLYEYKDRPMLCQKCLEYGHRTKFCSKWPRCKKCHEETHVMENCEKDEALCFHCKGKHITGSKICSQYKYEEEILAIQSKERVNRAQARVIMEKRNPNYRMTYATVTKSQSGTTKEAKSRKEQPDRGEHSQTARRKQDGEEKEAGKKRAEADGGVSCRRARTEVVCQSPGTGNLFTTTVEIEDIPHDAVDDGLPEDVLRETQEIYNSYEPMEGVSTQEQCNADYRAYEEELRRANRQDETTKKERKTSRTRSEGSSGEESGDRKNKKKKAKRSRSNSNQERKSSTSSKKKAK